MAIQEKTMTTQEVADRFYELAQKGEFDQIQMELFGENVKSIEPEHSSWGSIQGIDAVREKAEKWNSMVEEMHGGYTRQPQIAGNYFVCIMGMDVTLKGQDRMKMDEVALYKVDDGKIVEEQFFY